ncbi:uncharacterized protein LOC112453567 [Temnothorax curvispinosus]|uniref:Uncharacterized protein LOC112453567 n=1 Tax=Temnothorax curvispinosus TaxID=300111 RepID=A0A6J1PM15_9HYME|nr:uncharacterized protein LOC112453567 [Temnothorax curvispinosus]
MILCRAKLQSVKLLQQLLASLVELGLYSFGNEVASLCCDTIQALTMHIHKEVTQGRRCKDIMAPFELADKSHFVTLNGFRSDLERQYASLPSYILLSRTISATCTEYCIQSNGSTNSTKISEWHSPS